MTYKAREQRPTPVTDLSFEAFGVMTARRGTEEISVGPPRHRALLGLLLIRLGQVVPTEQLVDELWGTRPPRRPQATLQTYLSHLRRALTWRRGTERAAVPLRYQAPGYVLMLEPEAFDLSRFEGLVARGQRHAAADRLAAAGESLGSALELWRAEPFVDLTSYAPLAEDSARLQQLRTIAVSAYADTLLALGRAADAVATLRREVIQHSTDEHMVATLMTGLYRLGRQAEALQLYDRTRSHLSEELGVTPGRELEQVHLALLRHELGHDTAPVAPTVETCARPRGTGPAADPTAHMTSGHTTSGHVAAEHAATGSGGAGRAVPGTAAADGGGEDGPRPTEPAGGALLPYRKDSLDALRQFITGALQGSGHLTAVLGEAGVGKTELVARVTAGFEASAARPDVIRVSCRSTDGMPAGWVWQEVLRRLEDLRRESFQDIRGQLVPDAMATLFNDRTYLFDRPTTPVHFLAHDALCETVLRCADDGPLLLVLEDAHRADRPTLDVLGLLGSRTQNRPLSVVVTIREPGLGAGPEPEVDGTLAELLADSRTRVVHLENLPEADVRTVIEAQAGSQVAPAVVEALYERSAGNPYLLGQLLTHAGGAQRLHDPRTADVVHNGIPKGIRTMLRQRLSGLPARVLRILKGCAVLGPEADLTVLSGMLDDGEADHDIVEEVLRTGLMLRDRDHPHRLVFRYLLARDVLLVEMGGQERADLHARAVEVLSTRLPDSPDATEHVAQHAWQAALTLPTEDVVQHLMRAGEQATTDERYGRARTWFQHAHTLLSALPADGGVASEQALYLRTRLLFITSVTHD